MYPLGHFSIALATRDSSRNIFRLLFCCFLTILPDFDFLLGFEHRTFTHSIVFSFIVGLIISRKKWLYYSFLILSHSLLDMLCYDHPRNGVQLFWPFSSNYYQFPFHPFYATPMNLSMGIEFIFLFNLLIIRETFDKTKKFILNGKCPI